MCIEMLDFTGRNAGLRQSRQHRPARTIAVLGTCGHVVGVRGGAVTDEFGKRSGTAGKSMVQRFDHQHAGAFAHDETIAAGVEGAGGFFRPVAEAGGECARRRKATEADLVDAGLRAPADCHIGFTGADQAAPRRRSPGRLRRRPSPAHQSGPL